MVGTIELTAEESTLLKQIDFNDHSYDALRRSCAASATLTPLLLDRGAIPAERLAYFTDPEFNDGKRSREAVYAGNGTAGDEVFGYSGFLKHLRYFIHGNDLPIAIQRAMADAVGDPREFSRGDLEPVRALARRLMREHGPDQVDADRFFQLMVDLGVRADHAHSVRRTVTTVRSP